MFHENRLVFFNEEGAEIHAESVPEIGISEEEMNILNKNGVTMGKPEKGADGRTQYPMKLGFGVYDARYTDPTGEIHQIEQREIPLNDETKSVLVANGREGIVILVDNKDGTKESLTLKYNVQHAKGEQAVQQITRLAAQAEKGTAELDAITVKQFMVDYPDLIVKEGRLLGGPCKENEFYLANMNVRGEYPKFKVEKQQIICINYPGSYKPMFTTEFVNMVLKLQR